MLRATPHDLKVIERYSQRERSLDETCKHLGYNPKKIICYLKSNNLKEPTSETVIKKAKLLLNI